MLPYRSRTKAGVNRHDVTVPPAALPTSPPKKKSHPLAETIQKPDHVTAHAFKKKKNLSVLPSQRPIQGGMMTLFPPARPSPEKKKSR